MSASLGSMQVRPRCPVRGCRRRLVVSRRAWRCEAEHSFDVARSGYVNLLQPQDRRSKDAGDSRAAVLARERLATLGLGRALEREILEQAAGLDLGPGKAVLDVGSGPGFLLSAFIRERGVEGWGVDLSLPAIERASTREPRAHWIVANADRELPFEDGSFDLVVSSTGPKNWSEYRRILAVGGRLIATVPAPDDLIELRELLQGEGRRLDRLERLCKSIQGVFACERRSSARERALLDKQALADLLASTYRGARHRERARFETLDSSLEVTLAAEVLRLAPLG